MKTYIPTKIEKKWQKVWSSQKPNKTTLKKKFYNLVEFPYPSGNLHMGHWYSFAVPDIFARFKQMQGYDVIYPMGFDAFGLPAENAAIKNNLQPADWTKQNIKTMTKQMKSMGTMFDWSRTVSTIDPDYYRWTQWIFLQFYKAGLAYRAKTLVNWCPNDKTVLANEQVVDGKCDRCHNDVEQREREQWMYRITKYADALVDDLEKVDWPKTTKIAQQNWIGKSKGINITYQIENSPETITCFTTTPVNFAATFIILAPEHGSVKKITTSEHEKEVTEYINKTKNKSNLDRIAEGKKKTGVFTGAYALNQVTKEKMPIWISDFVLANVGTGAVQGCPGHDMRDFEFATAFNIPIKRVVVGPNGDTSLITKPEQVIEKGMPGTMVNSDFLDGLPFAEAMEKTKEYFEQKGWGKRVTTYRLRDWILSRQRYWGTPIPMIHCETCGYVPVPEDQLPIKLPKLENYLPADDGSSPLARAEKWVKTKCPQCGKPAVRETDTMDTFVDSSWYFLRYTDAKNKNEFASKESMAEWLPVDLYTGGSEHNTMHLLYSRFFIKAMYELGLVDFDEPFTVRKNHGTVLGPDGSKMSKSKGNIIDPDKEVAEFGADAVRMYLAFLGPYETFNGPWAPQGITGISRFLNKVWKIAHESEQTTENNQRLHQAIKKVSEDIEHLHFNTAISELMKLLNDREIVDETFLKLLAPFAPHLAEELWGQSHKTSIHSESWPEYDPKLIVETTVDFIIQVNGKTRGIINLPADSTEEIVKKAAEDNENIKRYLTGQIKKIIFVKGRLCNLIV